MTYVFAAFCGGCLVWWLGPIVTKTVTASIKKIREEYDKD